MDSERTTSDSSHESRLSTDARIVSLFEPDALVPAQYFEQLRRKTIWEPEKRLMLAVFEDAVNCFQDNLWEQSGKRKKSFDEVEEWILAKDGDWIFSFENICEVLGFNPDYVRQGLLRWKEQKLSRQPTEDRERKKRVG
jgi:hypothetical protein